MNRLKPTRILAAGCLLTLAACGSDPASKSNVDPYVDGATFTLAISADPGGLDPQMSVLQEAMQVNRFAYDSLVHQAADGTVVSGLAEKWTVGPSSVTFTLKSGVTCGDGTSLTAADVAANFDFIKDPKTQSPLVGLYMPSKDFKVTHNEAARSVTITTASPYGFLLLGAGSIPIVCRQGTADRTLLRRKTDGTGPYVLTDSIPGDHYTLTLRSGYSWGPNGAGSASKGLPAKVVVRVIPNESTVANLLLSGVLNAAEVKGPDRQRLLAAKLPEVTFSASPGEIFFNENPGHPASDPAVRMALAMALNTSQLGKVSSGGTGKPPTGLVSIDPKPCSGDTVKGHVPNFDPTAAAATLDSAGWVSGSGGVRSKNGQTLKLKMIYASTEGTDLASAMELAASNWKSVGIDVVLQPSTETQLSQTVFGTGDWDAGWLPIGVTLPSQLVGFMSGPKPPHGSNFAGIANSDYARLSGHAIATPGAAGCRFWNRAEEALFSQADVLPVVSNTAVAFGKNATFKVVGGDLDPTSIRMTAH